MIAIIGSGLAGLTAARHLAFAGHLACVFDKGRGPGGRLATRRGGDVMFDHGAARLTAKRPAFAAALKLAVGAGTAARWPVQSDSFVGVPEMKAPFVDLPPVVRLHQSVRIMSVTEDGGWHLTDEGGARHGPFRAVICTVPPAQAADLVPAQAARLHAVRMAPQWAAMLAWDGGAPVQGDLLHPGGVIETVQVMASKPGRPAAPCAVVLHATPDWTCAHLDLTRPEAAQRLLAEAQGALGLDLPPPDSAHGHRWLYARCEVPLGAPFLAVAPTFLLGGDWALGRDAEHAYESGLAMANAVIEALPEPAPLG
ncbi:NAD(P)/FAD-dependent oxidoreductase [Anianabacter salinae]|uniref:NAD(P)/FAD-dependent oxidoreductase n=1 Tax=Anianabacter salinae TaxID=2851023 RepID=UPI00225DDF44|nr:FAD-dependent oxidoreductase [Anianabacter salinae]MBV0912392.1 FAD-dependent oxidoreductase [Anianabacter salinae]